MSDSLSNIAQITSRTVNFINNVILEHLENDRLKAREIILILSKVMITLHSALSFLKKIKPNFGQFSPIINNKSKFIFLFKLVYTGHTGLILLLLLLCVHIMTSQT